MTHIYATRAPAGRAICGALHVRTMSPHEIKRGRITCPACLAEHAREEAAHRAARDALSAAGTPLFAIRRGTYRRAYAAAYAAVVDAGANSRDYQTSPAGPTPDRETA